MTATDRTTAANEKATEEPTEEQSESIDTPAAHIRTQASIQQVRERVDMAEGLVRVSHRSNDIESVLFYEPADAEALADRLVTAAAEARENKEVETND